ncbi:GNAT family N-acetyltransferase [Rhodovibrio salinarum]|uniref:N-acetyltransferase n=1 Tax=Rhodovibrio salinarum TaxID=1087 RepID=A0A934QHK5_9PROT|nr:GNAT family N-acetyltransferase [Rhodovibrio salinarum]MBK1697163.1 N-acetyltransferase [Rhodovibrio salinarum]
MSRPVEIRRAVQAPEYEAARRLLREYEAEIGADLCFQHFAAELAELPTRYAGPAAGLWLAWGGALPLGCIALSPAGPEAPQTGELKRLYVRPEAQGTGLGRALSETAITAARTAGYADLRLETLDRLVAARRLYEALGFAEVADFTMDGRAPGTRFLARRLSAADHSARSPHSVRAQFG